jgi:hypothetical protein
MMRSRKGMDAPIYALMAIVIVLVMVVVYFFLIRKYGVAADVFRCSEGGECAVTCPDEYDHDMSGDPACRNKNANEMCCKPGITTDPSGINIGDIKILYQNDKGRRINDGDSVTLTFSPTYSTNSVVEGTFTTSFGTSLSKAKCYWQVGVDDGLMYSRAPSSVTELFNTLLADYSIVKNGGNVVPVTMLTNAVDCNRIAGTSKLTLKLTDYRSYFGRRIKFNLVAINPDTCDGEQSTIDSCQSRTLSFSVQVPDRQPAISLKVDGVAISRTSVTSLSVGQTHTFDIEISEPFSVCSVQPGPVLRQASSDSVQSPTAKLIQSLNVVDEPGCFSFKKWQQRKELLIPEDAVRGIPFNLNITTRLDSSLNAEKRVLTNIYSFLIAPDPRVRVDGPAPGLNRLKTVDITCSGVTCSPLQVAYLDNPLDCHQGVPDTVAKFAPAPVVSYGGTSSGRSRMTIENETNNGRYVCIKALTFQSVSRESISVYALGLWQQTPVPLAIDRTPPSLKVSYDPFKSVLTMDCNDPPGMNPPITGDSATNYVSGCARRPFSYTYITDPLAFVTSVGSLGFLKDTFHGCNDLTPAASWITYNSDRKEMEYISRDVRVMCVRAMDNAGNVNITSKLLYSGQEALGLFLSTVMKKVTN